MGLVEGLPRGQRSGESEGLMCPAEEGMEPPTSTSLMLYFILCFSKE